jgi:hypothetical protein
MPAAWPAVLRRGGGVDVVECGDHEIGTGRGEQAGVAGSCDADRGQPPALAA